MKISDPSLDVKLLRCDLLGRMCTIVNPILSIFHGPNPESSIAFQTRDHWDLSKFGNVHHDGYKTGSNNHHERSQLHSQGSAVC